MKKVWCAFKDIVMIICVIFIGLLILLLALIFGGINWVWMKCTKKDEVLIPFGNWILKIFLDLMNIHIFMKKITTMICN